MLLLLALGVQPLVVRGHLAQVGLVAGGDIVGGAGVECPVKEGTKESVRNFTGKFFV